MPEQGEHGIAWTHRTWNPLRGCSRVSQGCVNCYAEGIAARFSDEGSPFHTFAKRTPSGPRWTGKVELIEEHLCDPLKWRKPALVFVNSMSDLFHEELPDEAIDRIFAVMALAQRHTFQVLTKRADRMLEYCNGLTFERLRHWMNRSPNGHDNDMSPFNHESNLTTINRRTTKEPARPQTGPPLKNVQLGVSVESDADHNRIWQLLKTSAALRFISYEPALGPLDLNKWELLHKGWRKDATIGTYLDWVICGGESGPGARPMHPDWARSVRDQCGAAGVPFFFKQWGEYLPADQDVDKKSDPQELNCSHGPIRVGKKRAGALLDGREWREFPNIGAAHA